MRFCLPMWSYPPPVKKTNEEKGVMYNTQEGKAREHGTRQANQKQGQTIRLLLLKLDGPQTICLSLSFLPLPCAAMEMGLKTKEMNGSES